MMPHRAAFDSWNNNTPEPGSEPVATGQHPPSPLDLIPAAEPRSRNREWDQKHRAWSYKVPEIHRQMALDLRNAITGIAQAGSTTTDEIASAIISFALTRVERGEFKIEGHPDPRRQKMAVIWEESESNWPQEIPAKKSLGKKKHETVKKSLYLAYRWPSGIHNQICRISGDTLSRGEVVVALLQHGLDQYRQGGLRMKFQPKTSVVGGWS